MESYLGKSIVEAARELKSSNLELGYSKVSHLIKEMLIQIKCLSKNHSGPLKRGDIDTDNYKFYDEREWRFIPQRVDIGGKSRVIDSNSYKFNKSKYNDDISSYRIHFSPSDISYIIVKNTSEIPQIIEFLRTTYYNYITGSELDILLSKVCSTEQIIQDY